MEFLCKRRSNETLQGYLKLKDGSKVPFSYSEETPRKFEQFNTFIQGMEFVMATATISTTTELAITYDDNIILDNGITLKVKKFEPVINKRRALMCRQNAERWIMDLK